MNMKKIIFLLSIVGVSACLTACQSQSHSKEQENIEDKPIDFKKDAVDKKTKIVDGKEVTEYTMPDGNVVQIPADGEEPTDSSAEE